MPGLIQAMSRLGPASLLPVAARSLGQVHALLHRRGDQFPKQVLRFGQCLVAGCAGSRAPPEIRECDDIAATAISFDVGGVVVGARHGFDPLGLAG